MPRRLILGVTGNIATGKSTVVRMLVEKGAKFIDSDLVYRDLVRPGMPLLRSLVKHFGDDILTTNGELNRKALGAIVFSDADKLRELDGLAHPAIVAEADRRAFAIDEGVVILDAVKLIESGHAGVCDEVWLVTAPESVQIGRIVARNNVSRDEAERRVHSQPPLEPKLAGADVIIPNDDTLETLQGHVNREWSRMIEEHHLR